MYVSQYTSWFPVEDGKAFVLCNGLSGAVDVVDESTVRLLESIRGGDGPKAAPDEIEVLLKRGYVFNDAKGERELFERLFSLWRQKEEELPIGVFLITTYSCNLRCSYCFQGQSLKSRARVMDLQTLEKAFRAMHALAEPRRNKSIRVYLIGGEPLQDSRRLHEINESLFSWCDENAEFLDVTTNGVDLTKYIDLLKKSNVRSVQVTLDGPREIHDRRRIYSNGGPSFDRIVEGIDESLENGIKIAVRVNVDSDNLSALPSLADYICGKGWDRHEEFMAYLGYTVDAACTGLSYVIPGGPLLQKIFNLRESYPQMKVFSHDGWVSLECITHLLEEKEPFFPKFSYCGASNVLFVLDAYGDVYPCLYAAGKENLRVGTFVPELALDAERLAPWRNRNVLTIPKCTECTYGLVCGGGCGFHALTRSKTFAEPYCEPTPEAVLSAGFAFFYHDLLAMANGRPLPRYQAVGQKFRVD